STETILKKIDPLISVPTAVNTGAKKVVLILLFKRRKTPNIIIAVTGLSMIFAICPPGAAVVNAETTPVAKDSSKTYFGFGNKTIPKNIMANSISGFTPNKIGGTTA